MNLKLQKEHLISVKMGVKLRHKVSTYGLISSTAYMIGSTQSHAGR